MFLMIDFCTFNVNHLSQRSHWTDLSSTSTSSEHPAWVMFCHIEFKNKIFCCKSLKFSKKENQEKSCGLMNKERQKQTRALFHLFPCYRFFSDLHLRFLLSTPSLWPTFPFYIPENTREPHSLWRRHRAKLGTILSAKSKWDHHWLTQIWPPIHLFRGPCGNIRKPKALRHFQGDTKPEDQQEKGQVTR